MQDRRSIRDAPPGRASTDAVPSDGALAPVARRGRLLKRLRSLAGAFGARFGWNWIGFALGLGIVGISLYVLSHLLRDIEPSRVLAAARATPPRSIASAIFFLPAPMAH